MNRTYKIISYSLLIIVLLYIAIGQWIMASHINVNTKFFWLTGTPSLEIRHNVIRLQLKVDSTILELQFTKPLNGPVIPWEPKNANLAYKVNLSTERDWLTIKAIDKKSLQNIPLALTLSDPKKAGYIPKRYVKTVRIDHNQHPIPDFSYNVLSLDSSNTVLYYPFHFMSLSGYLANTFGYHFMFLIVLALLVLFLCQIILFTVSICYQPQQAKNYFDKPEENIAITFIDSVADRFAIPLGFLGTVVSVWYSLEEPGTDYRSFVQILEIVKIAIFTTVLGLTTKVLCIIRGRFPSIFSPRGRRKG